MTQDIIEMARQAGLPEAWISETGVLKWSDLEAFAKLVAAKATDEANARANTSWTLMCKKMVEDEREACARVCEVMVRNGAWITKEEVAAAIRARGNT